MNTKIILVGAGRMARDYAKVLNAQKISFAAIGRGETSAAAFEKETRVTVIRGGLTKKIIIDLQPTSAIVATPIDSLGETTRILVDNGVKKILVEKPAGLNAADIEKTLVLANKNNANIYIGYNRRHYASVIKAREIIAADGGVISFFFDFTERTHEVEALAVSADVKQNWFLANSSHVADLAFFLGGHPVSLSAKISGHLPWHPTAAVFVGHGVSDTSALFSYHADWLSGGRWAVEIMTPKRKLILRPLEKLFEMVADSFEIKEVALDDSRDISFKPGLYSEVEAFFQNNPPLLTLQKHVKNLAIYDAISTGKNV